MKVNRQKTEVAHISKVKYLGYSFYRYKGKCRLRVHPKSVEKMKNKLRALTDRSNGDRRTGSNVSAWFFDDFSTRKGYGFFGLGLGVIFV